MVFFYCFKNPYKSKQFNIPFQTSPSNLKKAKVMLTWTANLGNYGSFQPKRMFVF